MKDSKVVWSVDASNYQGRKWLPNTGWASSNVARGSAFYSTKIWVGNCPPCPSATYAPVRWGRRLFRPEVLNSSVFIWFWLIVDRGDVRSGQDKFWCFFWTRTGQNKQIFLTKVLPEYILNIIGFDKYKISQTWHVDIQAKIS